MELLLLKWTLELNWAPPETTGSPWKPNITLSIMVVDHLLWHRSHTSQHVSRMFRHIFVQLVCHSLFIMEMYMGNHIFLIKISFPRSVFLFSILHKNVCSGYSLLSVQSVQQGCNRNLPSSLQHLKSNTKHYQKSQKVQNYGSFTIHKCKHFLSES